MPAAHKALGHARMGPKPARAQTDAAFFHVHIEHTAEELVHARDRPTHHNRGAQGQPRQFAESIDPPVILVCPREKIEQVAHMPKPARGHARRGYGTCAR